MTFYDILGVGHDASPAEIRTAYRELARRYHPDGKSGMGSESSAGAEEMIKAVNAAYETLSHPGRRRAYDQLMNTSQDPAREYGFPQDQPASAPKPRPNKHSDHAPSGARESSINAIYTEIRQTRAEFEQLLEQHQLKRRNFWMSAAFTSLVLYFLMALGLQLFPTEKDLFPLLIFFLGGELISYAIILNAGGMKLEQFPFGRNPITFSMTIFLGTLLSSFSVSQQGFQFIRPDGLYFGIVMSLVLLIHLFLVTRLGKRQDAFFSSEIRRLDDHLQKLEDKLRELRNQSNV